MNEDETRHLIETGLARRAAAAPRSRLSLDDVRDRARAVRRRQRSALALGAAALTAAVLVPVAVLGGGDDGRAIDPAPPVPTPTVTSAPTAQGTSVLRDGTLTRPDGSTVELDVRTRDVGALTVLADGRTVVADSGTGQVRVFAADGGEDLTYPVRLVHTRPDALRTSTAWVDPEGAVRVLGAGSEEAATLPRVPVSDSGLEIVDAVLGGSCPDADCRVLVGDGNLTTSEVTPDGVRDLVTSEPLRVLDVSPDGATWSVSFPPAEDQQYGCSGLYDPVAAQVLARSCEVTGLAFSPDGRHLISVRGDNNMAGEAVVVDRALREVGRFDPARQVVSRVAWADADRLLVSVAELDGNRWSLVRVGLSGQDPEVLVGPVSGGNPEAVAEFVLSR